MLKQQNIIGIGTHNGITTIHTTNHKYETTEPLNRYEKQLNPAYFIRIHRSYIINTKHIKEKCDDGLTARLYGNIDKWCQDASWTFIYERF